MPRRDRPPAARRRIARTLLLVVATLLAVGGVAAAPAASVSAASRWTGGVDLYRRGVFTTQQTWLWCTGANVQIMRNIVAGQADHSRAGQQRYFAYMRTQNRYSVPVSDGVDPAGWTAGLRRYVDSRYRLVQSTTFDSALRSAVTNLRKTSRPVGLLVAGGGHAWILTGFTATADPASTTRFTVTSVRVVGPLWGLQNRAYGYDMAPDRRLTPTQLRGFLTPWHYAPVRMAWEGRYVTIQAVPTATQTTARPKPDPKPKPKHDPKPKPKQDPKPKRADATRAPGSVPTASTVTAPSAPATSNSALGGRPAPHVTPTTDPSAPVAGARAAPATASAVAAAAFAAAASAPPGRVVAVTDPAAATLPGISEAIDPFEALATGVTIWLLVVGSVVVGMVVAATRVRRR